MIKASVEGRKTVICLFNSYINARISGGDVRFIEVFKRIKCLDKIIVTSLVGKRICEHKNLNGTFVITTKELLASNIVFTYFVRVVKALFLKMDNDKDIVYSTSDFLTDTFPAFVWKLRSQHLKWVQVVHHLYDTPFRRKGERFLTNLLGFLSQRIGFFLIKRKADAVIVVSPPVRQCLIELGFDSRKIRVLYNGIDKTKIQHFEPSNNQLKKYDCVFLGRLNVSKGLFDLIDIWRVLLKNAPHASLAIIGGGNKQIKQELENRVRQYNLQENVSILGYMEDEEAFGTLKSSRVFVFPSYEEGFGIAILEAMACGLPVVAWDLLVYKAIFQRGMITVPLKNTRKFAEVVLELLDNEQLRRNLSLDAAKTSVKYDWGKVAEKELNLIECLMKEK
jgi:glycosyltransferase involved in cell wall biosynthesis